MVHVNSYLSDRPGTRTRSFRLGIRIRYSTVQPYGWREAEDKIDRVVSCDTARFLRTTNPEAQRVIPRAPIRSTDPVDDWHKVRVLAER